jgi:DNA polymerase-3 subunit epsilon
MTVRNHSSSRLILDRPLAVLDLETTGLSPADARVVEVAVVTLRPDAPPGLFATRVNPGVPIPPAATAVHGITDADVAAEPRFAVVAGRLLVRLRGCDLAGFNLAGYDLPVLAREFARVGLRLPLAGRAVVDVLHLFRRQEPRDLAAAVRLYLGRGHDQAHGAAADAEVLQAQLARYPELPHRPAELHRILVEVDVGRRFRAGPGGEAVMNFG